MRTTTTITLDPYHDAFHNEVGPFIQALSTFQARIASFDYPENTVLQKLVQISQKIQHLPISSPLMRWLIGLETLLGKIQEWEQSAASFVSLRVEMAQLSRFVIRWRKFELESWSKVLDRRTNEARKRTSAMWFNMHENLLQAQQDKYWSRQPVSWLTTNLPEDTNNDQQVKPHLKVFQLIDEFCRLSTLGDFTFRCELLHAFANYCQVNGSGAQALAHTLRNLGLYYEQFNPNCKLALEQNRAPIQTKLENQVKISSWDDRNYFALKESADKSHRIILRLSKEFDTVLESPVHQVFTQVAKDYVAEEPKALANFVLAKNTAAIVVDLPEESTNTTTTHSAIYRRAKELVEKRIATNHNLTENHGIPRDLFEAIKDRLQSLDKDSPVQWKKRALVDLFNEFKLQLLGSPPVPHRLRDFREIFAHELTLAGTSPTSLFAGLFHLNHLRNLVRSPTSDRSEDLSMQECNRGVHIGETIMLMLLQQRETLVSLRKQQQQMGKELLVWDKLCTASKSGNILYVFDVEANASLELELDLVLKACRDLDFLAIKLVPSHVSLRALQVLVGIQQEIEKIKLEQCCSSLQAEDLNARFRSEMHTTSEEVSRMAKLVPSCDKLVQKVAQMQNQSFHFNAIQLRSSESEEEETSVQFVQTCQVFIQPLARETKTAGKEDGDSMLHAHHAWLLAQNKLLRPSSFVCAMQKLTSQALQGELSLFELESKHSIVSLAKLAHHVLLAYYQAFLSFHNSLARLQEFILKLFRSVVEKGFCRPPEETEQEEGVDENLKDGTGMGEGQGQDNVSKEIEDEEQLLGLKGDKHEDGPEKNKDDKKDEEEQDGVEMENDFDGGEMHDMDREDEQNEDEDQDDDEEDKEELDRDMGDTGDQSQTVDEKLWDEKEDEKTEDEKFEDNAPMKGEEQELRAKDEDENENKQQPKKEEEEKKSGKKNEQDEDEGGEVDEEEDDGEFKAEEMEENSGLDKEQEQDAEEEEEAGDETIPEMEGKVDDDVEPEDFEMPDTGPPENGNDDDDAAADSGGEDLNELAEEEEDENEDRAPSPPPPEEEESDGKVTLPTQANEENEHKEEQDDDNNDDAFLGKGTTSTRNNNNDSNQDQPSPEQEEDDTPGVSNQTGGTSGGTGGERYRKGGEPEEDNNEQDKAESEQNKRKDLNPWRDPGDASKEWSRRKKIIETVGQAEENNNDESGEDDMDNQTVEFKRKDGDGEDDEKEPFDQALGARDDEAADQEQVNMENDDDMEDEEQEANNKKKQDEEDDAAEELNPAEKKEDAKKQKQQQQQRPKRGKFFDDLEESSSDEEEEEDEQAKDRVEEAPTITTTKAADPFLLFTKREEEEEDKAISMEEVEIANMAGDEVDNALLSDEALERGRALWQGAVNETFESAQHLCEQLRLVLEPTTATKLKGDYRTGTRINMRRVIAYIASGYKKDKIWQKRSKPSRRKYHIALAIDDSKSMKPCKDLALAALALITRALTQLEVGEVGIWSFGDDVKKLHDLSKPFSETSGALVSAHFGFDQNSTSIEQGLSTVIDTLSAVAANDSKMTEQPRQLVFVISDGRFDTGSRPRIAKLLRAAKERRQLVALIVVEPEEAAESILEVRQVSFRTDGSGGVTMNRYLEDYPFPYYIVLRDMKALPEVLADGLKQWFELIVGDAM